MGQGSADTGAGAGAVGGGDRRRAQGECVCVLDGTLVRSVCMYSKANLSRLECV